MWRLRERGGFPVVLQWIVGSGVTLLCCLLVYVVGHQCWSSGVGLVWRVQFVLGPPIYFLIALAMASTMRVTFS